MRTSLGINEALILACLATAPELTIAGVAEKIQPHRDVDDGSLYVALQRMTERGFVTVRKTRAPSADGRMREIGIYAITGDGARAADKFADEAAAVARIRFHLTPSGA